MIDYRYWFGIGKSPIKKEQFSPAMVTAIKAMLSNPEEAWWVIDGALTALRFAPAGEVDDCLPLIKPWTTHEDWWLREAAFNAMLALQDDEKLLAKVLPTLNQMMVDEYHTMPRQRFNNELNQLLKKNKSTPAGRQILSAFLRAVKESEIKPDQGRQTRSSEGAHNVLTTAEICLREAPEHAIEVARIIKSRSTLIGTTQIMRLIATPNYSPESKPYGFCTLLEKLPAEQKKELTDILCKEYLPELKRRRKAESNNDQSLINTIIDLVKLSNPDAGWQPVGTPLPAERTWRFTSFDPPEEEKMHPREKKRFRNVSLPEGIEKWYMPEFDDSGWKTGKAPIGIGVHKRGGVSFRNNSEWGSGEFLLMRTEFEIEDLAYDSFRLSILAKQGFHVYLNGHKISSYVWWKDMPHYRFITLSENQVKLLKKGRNVLAAYGNVEYDKNTIKPSGQMDLLIEGLNTANLE
jgi:hypothetical protein